MAAINLLNLTPHKVSKDLSGYITFIYGGYVTMPVKPFLAHHQGHME